jgi:hypothetical protein
MFTATPSQNHKDAALGKARVENAKVDQVLHQIRMSKDFESHQQQLTEAYLRADIGPGNSMQQIEDEVYGVSNITDAHDSQPWYRVKPS